MPKQADEDVATDDELKPKKRNAKWETLLIIHNFRI
jgi:hypothetical protein